MALLFSSEKSINKIFLLLYLHYFYEKSNKEILRLLLNWELALKIEF